MSLCLVRVVCHLSIVRHKLRHSAKSWCLLHSDGRLTIARHKLCRLAMSLRHDHLVFRFPIVRPKFCHLPIPTCLARGETNPSIGQYTIHRRVSVARRCRYACRQPIVPHILCHPHRSFFRFQQIHRQKIRRRRPCRWGIRSPPCRNGKMHCQRHNDSCWR